MARDNAKRDDKGDLDVLSLKPMKGGVASEAHMKYKRGGQGGGGMHDYETQGSVHATRDALIQHIDEMLGHCFTHAKEEAAEVKSEKEGKGSE